MIDDDDRRVHAANREVEVVRYDRAGKWYIEPRDRSLQRQHVTVKQAAEYAVWLYEEAGGTIIHGVPGGGSFDAVVVAANEHRVLNGDDSTEGGDQ